MIRIISMEAKLILSRNIDDYLTAYKKSQAEFSRDIGVNPQYIHLLRNGLTNPQLEMIDKLASAMGCTQADLFTEGYFSKFETKIVKKKAK